jgi:hypothetical protein
MSLKIIICGWNSKSWVSEAKKLRRFCCVRRDWSKESLPNTIEDRRIWGRFAQVKEPKYSKMWNRSLCFWALYGANCYVVVKYRTEHTECVNPDLTANALLLPTLSTPTSFFYCSPTRTVAQHTSYSFLCRQNFSTINSLPVSFPKF